MSAFATSLAACLLAGAVTGAGPAPAFDTSDSTGRPRGPGGLVPSEVGVGHHDGYDRVVLELVGRSSPGWSVRHVRRAVQEGTGRRVSLPGEGVLQLDVSGTTFVGPEAECYYDGPRRVRGAAQNAIREVYVGGTFEGVTQLFVGLDDRGTPFRVLTLRHPTRLVVDVAHDD